MNKSGFIAALQEQTGCTQEQCIVINDVLESHFIFRKKNKPKITADIAEKLTVPQCEAENIYEQAMSIIRAEKKNALKHPFGKNN